MQNLKIKLFMDGADRPMMVEMAKNPKVAGFTTNPSLMKKAGVTDYRAYCHEILPYLAGKPVSFEVFADEFFEMKRQALEIKTWASNVYVKIPVTNSKGEFATDLIRELSQAGVKLNVTAIFSVPQAAKVTQALKGGAPSIVSVFAGRLADFGHDPLPIMKASSELCKEAGKQIELLWASTREVFNIIEAERCGCEIITAPADLIKKADAFGSKSLEQLSLEAVQQFKKDSETAGFKL